MCWHLGKQVSSYSTGGVIWDNFLESNLPIYIKSHKNIHTIDPEISLIRYKHRCELRLILETFTDALFYEKETARKHV
jgi:hypothetical protein